ncbi:hypothetical protein BRARA_A03906 [Brassica rapa]|uniref:Uncharacterized protein n=1 Tax=Brassica campestris TaxID=3711 RepID=A0A398AUC1_BRACM|nr:hypothetical protein BRARA_A03906 [Brassica rapa]
MVRSWRYVHDDVYGDLSLAVCRLTLHPWQLTPMVQNTVLTDRSRNHPEVRSLIGIRICRLTLHPWQLAPMVQNTVLTDRSRNHPGVRSLIGIRSMSMTARPRRSVYDTSSMAI